jgi:hypothetical protein
MRYPILGPVMADLDKVGLDKGQLIVATAFYSRPRLEELAPQAERIDLLVRLDLSTPLEWIAGGVAPDALLDFAKKEAARGAVVRIFCGATAHAKVYLGAKGFFVGSANLTVRGFGGLANEVLWYEDHPPAMRIMRQTLGAYRQGLSHLAIDELEHYVQTYSATVKAAIRSRRHAKNPEAELPPGLRDRASRLGDYPDFIGWLEGRRDPASDVIRRRARGEGQLSGHIRRNFFGLRQFLVAHPSIMRLMATKDPAQYRLYRDSATQERLHSFVMQEAADEADLSVSTWRTYLPESSGGKPKTGGGTSGNLNRMLPLIAEYLVGRVGFAGKRANRGG